MKRGPAAYTYFEWLAKEFAIAHVRRRRSFLFGTEIHSQHYKTWLEIPDAPTKTQRWVAYCMLKLGRVFFVRQPKRYMDYAFRLNATDVFKW